MQDAEGRDFVTSAEKRALLRDTLLPNIDRQHPLQVLALTRTELKDAVWAAAPDKAPGPDEIT
ncbi:hypothetical protein CF328_g8899, partial [Tilletia controversa]